MERAFPYKKLVLGLLVCGAAVTAIAWQDRSAAARPEATDTVPRARDRKVRNVEDALEEVERGRLELKRSMQDVDFDKIDREMKEAFRKMEFDEVKMKA